MSFVMLSFRLKEFHFASSAYYVVMYWPSLNESLSPGSWQGKCASKGSLRMCHQQIECGSKRVKRSSLHNMVHQSTITVYTIPMSCRNSRYFMFQDAKSISPPGGATYLRSTTRCRDLGERSNFDQLWTMPCDCRCDCKIRSPVGWNSCERANVVSFASTTYVSFFQATGKHGRPGRGSCVALFSSSWCFW